MICIGIDFSINHASAVIYDTENEKYSWVTVFNDTNFSIIGIERMIDANSTINDLDITFTEKIQEILRTRKKPKKRKHEYHVKEKIKLNNYLEVVDLFITQITEITQGRECKIAIEGLSFGSKGNQVFELGQATGMLKRELIKDVLGNDGDKLYVISPPSLKASYLKGNASKFEIFEHFVSESNPGLNKSVFYKYMVSAFNDSDTDVLTPKEIKAPWNDLVDSYTALHYLLKTFIDDAEI